VPDSAAGRLGPASASAGQFLRVGEELGGYLIEGLAGRGGMGVVYRAREPELDRAVALKVIAPALARDSIFRRRFEREWRMAAALEYPNVVPVYRAGEENGRLFLAMRFISGVDLGTVLEDRGRLLPDEAALSGEFWSLCAVRMVTVPRSPGRPRIGKSPTSFS
jgi:serine/threonine protein kinase